MELKTLFAKYDVKIDSTENYDGDEQYTGMSHYITDYKGGMTKRNIAQVGIYVDNLQEELDKIRINPAGVSDSFVKQGESILDQLADIDNQIVEMQKSESCYVNVSVIRGLIIKLKAEIDDMVHNPQGVNDGI